MNRRGFLAVAATAFLAGVADAQDAVEAMRFSALQPGARRVLFRRHRVQIAPDFLSTWADSFAF